MKINGVDIQTLPLNIPLTLPPYPVEVFIKPDDEDLEQFFRRVNDKVEEVENNNYGMVHVLLSDLHDFDQLPNHFCTYYGGDGVECSEFDNWEYVEHEIIHYNEWTKGMNVFNSTRCVLDHKVWSDDKFVVKDYINLCHSSTSFDVVVSFN